MRKLLCNVFLLVAAWPVSAQQTAVTTASPRTAVVRKALFWKVTSGNNTAYLLGSIHLGTKEMYPLPKEIEEAFDTSTVLAVEVDANHVDMAKAQAFLMEKGMYSGDDVLWNHISPETRKALEAFGDKYGMPAQMLAKMKPWMATIIASTLPMMKSGMDPSLGIDKYFLDKLTKTSTPKRVVEMESAEWQFQLFASFAGNLQEQQLAAVMESASDLKEMGGRLQEAWNSGDPERVEKLVIETFKGPDKVMRAVLQDRNPHMADVTEQMLKGKDKAFVVVGAAHMVGKEGIVKILQDRGYKVEQVALVQ